MLQVHNTFYRTSRSCIPIADAAKLSSGMGRAGPVVPGLTGSACSRVENEASSLLQSDSRDFTGSAVSLRAGWR